MDSLVKFFAPEEVASYNFTDGFTDPFRYVPHPLVKTAANRIMALYGNHFSEGKMLGVLIVADVKGRIGYLAGFSGNVGGKSIIDGFVPPIYDLTDSMGHFKKSEAKIDKVNAEIRALEDSPEFQNALKALLSIRENCETAIARMKRRMAESRKKREEIRLSCTNPDVLEKLLNESRHEKAELKRLRQRFQEKISSAEHIVGTFEERLEELKQRRREMSDKLQKWIFEQYIVHNALSESASIGKIFAGKGLVPPGGTGECAAPKLIEYAYRNSLTPLAMGEFWCGASPETAVRVHGHFYPSCTGKCKPLLEFMMRGLRQSAGLFPTEGTPLIIYEDETVIVASKPSGMPSVPGLDGKCSMQEWLSENLKRKTVISVHRLDMDTSGIMLFAKTREAATTLMQQFEEHSIRKTYSALLSADGMRPLKAGEQGSISVALGADYDERPRQKADVTHGKESVTEYRVEKVCKDGKAIVKFFPLTGRTHQLRVHSAHPLGLGRPIAGDLLYGGFSLSTADNYIGRLCLHAESITFRHPSTGEKMTFRSEEPTFSRL